MAAAMLASVGSAVAQDAAQGMSGALRDRFVGTYGRERLDVLAARRIDNHDDAAAWLSRWIDLNRPGAARAVSPAEVPLHELPQTP